MEDHQDQKLYKSSATDEHIPVLTNTLNKIVDEIQALKKVNITDSEDWNYKPHGYNKKVQIFCDNFFKHVDEKRCFGKVNATTINPCFTISQLLEKIKSKDYDEEVAH